MVSTIIPSNNTSVGFSLSSSTVMTIPNMLDLLSISTMYQLQSIPCFCIIQQFYFSLLHSRLFILTYHSTNSVFSVD